MPPCCPTPTLPDARAAAPRRPTLLLRQANKAGADEGLMLDPHGFVATCNSTNFFIVCKGAVWAPTSK
jgi:branched-subunit amino acid aminotransferase/4-amino-4-deoxychorismate lyase